MKIWKDVHWPIFLLAVGIVLLSFLFIYSATFRGSEHFMMKQLTWLTFAVCAFWFMVVMGYRTILNLSYVIYAVSVGLLIAVLIFGHTRQGAQRWFAFGPLVLQPSEFCKVATILALARFLSNAHGLGLGQKRSLITGALMVMVPLVLILKQPDLGTALLFIPIAFFMLFLWGVRLRYLIAIMAAGLISSPFLWFMLKPYQQKRLLVFLNPNVDPLGSGYTAVQSKIAVGAGGLIGKGWLQGTQNQLDFVPEHHTDFIFCVVGEEFGFLGALFLILLYAALIGYAIQVLERTTDQSARLVAVGVVAMLFFQVFINIGMTIGIAPITGITLPLVSYGGSSLVTTFLALGLLASIYKERSIF